MIQKYLNKKNNTFNIIIGVIGEGEKERSTPVEHAIFDSTFRLTPTKIIVYCEVGSDGVACCFFI